jgi:hypothetical protein
VKEDRDNTALTDLGDVEFKDNYGFDVTFSLGILYGIVFTAARS